MTHSASSPQERTGGRLEPSHPRCRHIATKTDYYRDPDQPLPYDPGAGSTAIYWCVLTQKSLGPDGLPCDRLDCSPVRSCYVDPARRGGAALEAGEEPIFDPGV